MSDIVRLELVSPESDRHEPWKLITAPRELQLTSIMRRGGEVSYRLQLNKAHCQLLGFGHCFDSKVARRHLQLYVKYDSTVELNAVVPILSHKQGLSRKVDWIGSSLQVILVRRALIATSGDSENESDEQE